MTTTQTPSQATELRRAKQQTDGSLVDFDEESLRNTLIQAAGKKLSFVADSSAKSVNAQIQAIRQSSADFENILERMGFVQTNIEQIYVNVGTMVEEAESSSDELEHVNKKMSALEKHFTAISGLVKTVSEIADQTKLLALNATIEAARAGEAGKGFAVVASEVKELSSTTKAANQEISVTLDKIGEAITDLSQSVALSVNRMQSSISAVAVTRKNALTIQQETNQFSKLLQTSCNNFRKLNESSIEVENETREVNTIGKTFSYLLEMMAMQENAFVTVDPLERLLPVVESSDFCDPERFAHCEREYVLREDDILISATDTLGKITFANNCFYEVAEYEPGELVGEPHNVIRHPDMPKTAFADLWAVIKTGRPWQGYVANQSRSGRTYWVKANVFPCFENKQIVGYLSIRTKPDRVAIEQAIEAYRLVV